MASLKCIKHKTVGVGVGVECGMWSVECGMKNDECGMWGVD